jgi:hypothetical protein
MLLSPNVLFITDRVEPDPAHRGGMRFDPYTLASRLSFFLWDAAPDDLVLQAAESGDILTSKGRARVVNMMLASPRVEAGMRAFFDDMLHLEDFSGLSKDASIYPKFTNVITVDAREQMLRTIVDHIVTKNNDYRDLFTTRKTFMSPALAALYNVPASAGWIPYEFAPDSNRQGIAMLVGFLAQHSHPGRTSATKRGKAIRELFLCQRVPDPPPNVDFTALSNPDANYKTARDRVNVHLENPVCAGCHKITDPIGLGMENFDGAGTYRTAEGGVTIGGLASALRDHPAVPSCLVGRVYAYAMGGPSAADDREALKVFGQGFAADGYRVKSLLRAVALSDAFAEVRQTPAAGPAAKSTDAGGQ